MAETQLGQPAGAVLSISRPFMPHIPTVSAEEPIFSTPVGTTQLVIRKLGHCPQKLVGELVANHGGYLRHSLHIIEAIKARH